eukprot:scaffold77799_cov38-Prasinocladus_malaysianus.AAC.1
MPCFYGIQKPTRTRIREDPSRSIPFPVRPTGTITCTRCGYTVRRRTDTLLCTTVREAGTTSGARTNTVRNPQSAGAWLPYE